MSDFDLKIRETLNKAIYTLKQFQVKSEIRAKGIHEVAQQLAILNLSEEEFYAYKHHVGDARMLKSMLESSFSEDLNQGKQKMIEKLHQFGVFIK